MSEHSRRCTPSPPLTPQVLGLADEAVGTLCRPALLHDFGTTVVPNSIRDKPGPFTKSEFHSVELHPTLTEQMLRRSPALAC
jgi:HD-GYP domain-containing protein (c-di-GMP phosphodiesterase class II)